MADSCYLIAEAGHNHQGDLATAEKMFLMAKEAGCDAVKLQKRDNASLYTRAFYNQPYNSENSYGATYGEHREALEFGWKEYVHLKAVAKDLDIDFFATAFDEPSVEFCQKLELPAIKIASGDLTNIPLLRKAGKTGLPLYLSTGGGTLEDICRALDAIGHLDVSILQCTASYPCKFEELNLNVIGSYLDEFPGQRIGVSLHDNGIASAVAAYAIGARVIEKHVTLDRTMKGTDHPFSLEPQGLSKMVRDIRRMEVAMGDGIKRTYPSEIEPLRKMAKRAYATRDLSPGTVLTLEDIVFKSPGGGISDPELLVGQTLAHGITQEEPIDYTDIYQAATG